MKELERGLVLLTLAAAGCGGGGSGGGSSGVGATAATAASPTPTPPAPAPPPPSRPGPPGTPPGAPPTGATLDAQVRTALANAGIATPAAAPTETAELVALGQALFFDKVLSGNRNISCATCHHPTAATGDALPLSLGEGATGTGAARRATGSGQVIARNAPPIFGRGLRGLDALFWDSRVRRDPGTGELSTPEPLLNGPTPARADLAGPLTSALAAQALFPVANAEEMRGHAGENELADAPDNVTVWSRIMARLVGTANGTTGGIEAYRALFRAAFPGVTNHDDLTFSHAARAIAAYEATTFGFTDAPLDRFLAGDAAAIPDAAKRGSLVFTGQARCAQCHRGPLLSDRNHHALAVPQLGPGKDSGDDRGRALVTGDARDDYRFRTAPLRNVALTGPFMHDGAFATLDRVLRHYRNPRQSLTTFDASALPADLQGTVDRDATRNQARLAALDPIVGQGLRFDDAQLQDLIAFLEALTDPAARTPVPVPASVPSGLPVAD